MLIPPRVSLAEEGADAAWPRDGSFIRVTRDGGLSPFTSIYYDVTVRGRTLVVTMVKDTACRMAQRERVALLGGPEALAAIERLRRAGAWSLNQPAGASMGRAADTAPSADSPRWEFWNAEGPSMKRFFVNRETLDRTPRLLGLLAELRGIVTGVVEPLPMRDVFHPASEIGFLAMTSSSPASAEIDGWDRFRLPVNALDLKVGVHEVVVTGTNGATRSFTVRIMAGETTSVHVLLEPADPSGR